MYDEMLGSLILLLGKAGVAVRAVRAVRAGCCVASAGVSPFVRFKGVGGFG